MKFLPRIKPGDIEYGNGYVENAKIIGRYFRTEFEKLRVEIEQTNYFREKLIYNYVYKGPLVEWYMRIKTKLEKDYQIFHELVPQEGKILDIGCGYGFMTYMLYFTANKRIITGLDYDEQKIETANHCFSKPATMNFVHADILAFNFEKYDAIILADILHYLQPDEQKQVIIKCMDHLNAGGKVIIREGDTDAISKHKKTILTEFFSTRLFKFNKVSTNGLSFLSGAGLAELAQNNNIKYSEISDSEITSNTIYVLTKIKESEHDEV